MCHVLLNPGFNSALSDFSNFIQHQPQTRGNSGQLYTLSVGLATPPLNYNYQPEIGI